MQPAPTFRSAEEAVNLMWPMLARLGRLFMWTVLVLAHLLALQLLLCVAWWQGWQPAALTAGALAWLQSTSGVVLGAAGMSATTVLAGYLWLLHRASLTLFDYLAR